jgi:hypothetical protein
MYYGSDRLRPDTAQCHDRVENRKDAERADQHASHCAENARISPLSRACAAQPASSQAKERRTRQCEANVVRKRNEREQSTRKCTGTGTDACTNHSFLGP